MSNTIDIDIELSASALWALDGAKGMEGRHLRAIATGMDRANLIAIRKISAERFTGRGPFPVSEHRLGVRSNYLRRSLRASQAVVSGGEVTSTMGSNMEYFGVHERGFKGTAEVRAHQRRAPLGDTFRIGGAIMSGKRLGAAGRSSARRAQESSRIARVRAHQRKLDIPARAPMATGISESGGIYSEQYSRAIMEAVVSPPEQGGTQTT